MAATPDRQSETSEGGVTPAPNAHTASTGSEASGTPAPGEHIGHYHIRRLVGAGGMGSVYEAVQEQPRRIVALKLMRPGVSSPGALRRFEYESQLLARLDHPAIAQVFEAGTHPGPAGEPLPYFAMQYIPDALPITEYARTRGLSIRQRLELFVRVCEAVAHGHAKGVIHRDLKPSNILVDVSGNPHVIDFGVARGTDSDLALTSLQTGHGQIVGTLQYMSPEQCAGDPRAIDHRTDIYALGIVLFELLCDRLPYDLSTVPVHEASRVIRETAPLRPSTIDRGFRGDIEVIIAKAMHKERERRYQSVEEFEGDVRRVLAGQAIAARFDSVAYIVRRRVQALALGHRAVALIAITAAAAAAGYFWGTSAFSLTQLDRRYQAACASMAAPVHPGDLSLVKVLGIYPDTPLAELAERDGVKEFDPQKNTSLRALHGRLLSRLAAAHPRVVVFDIAFRNPAGPSSNLTSPRNADPTDYDEPMLVGIRALRIAGIPTVVAHQTYIFTSDGEPPISRTIAAETGYGSTSFSGSKAAPWVVPLAREHAGEIEPKYSLSLATLAAWEQPNARRFTVRLDEIGQFARLSYWNPSTSGTGRRSIGSPTQVRVSVDRLSQPNGQMEAAGLLTGDLVAKFPLDPPSKSACDQATVPYEAVFEHDTQWLCDTFDGKVVLIADFRNLRDIADHPSGISLAGPYVQAAAINALIEDRTIHPIASSTIVLAVAGAILGVVIATARTMPWWSSLLLVLAVCAATFPVGMLLYARAKAFLDPAPLVLAMLAGALLTLALPTPRALPIGKVRKES